MCSYLIEGGDPGGSNVPPVFPGCLATSTIITIITIHGNRSTVPSGTEIFELPRKRILRRKNESRGLIFSLWREISLREDKFSKDGRVGVEGIRFMIFWTRPIGTSGRRCVHLFTQVLVAAPRLKRGYWRVSIGLNGSRLPIQHGEE